MGGVEGHVDQDLQMDARFASRFIPHRSLAVSGETSVAKGKPTQPSLADDEEASGTVASTENSQDAIDSGGSSAGSQTVLVLQSRVRPCRDCVRRSR
jgi:hypothetical protein